MIEQILHRIFYALLSGLTQVLPVSAQAHERLYAHLLNFDDADPWLRVASILGAALGIVFMLRGTLHHVFRENRHHRNTRNSKSHPSDTAAVNTMNLCKTALIILLPSMLAAGYVSQWISDLILLAIMLLVNGFVLFIPRLFASGDKNSLSMTPLDSLLVGLAGVFGLLPGISRLGMMASAANLRGIRKEFSVDFLLLVMVLPLLAWALFCSIGAFFFDAALETGMVIGDILAFVTSFAGACAGVWLLRKIVKYKDFSVFSFYSWGAAVVAFVLYLIF